MNVFDLDERLVGDYARFTRSFTQIRAKDIAEQVDAIYQSRRFWPEPLISINPHFERDEAVDALVRSGALHAGTGSVFRAGGQPITLYRHQAQAVAKAAARQSFVVTTGTGSGKSLCFFVPIIDAAIRARAAGEPQRTRAIVIYPMNALANSQHEELGKFLGQSDLPARLMPTFARYTGQESPEDREKIRHLKPDILLTNFMMLELLMTRQSGLDQAVIANACGLDFIVLDELHTYRGRQGADVAMLVRRVRDRLCRERAPVCIGTSATMASEDAGIDRVKAVAEVASRLFGIAIGTDGVIGESLERATDPELKAARLGDALGRAVDEEIDPRLTDAQLRTHPLAVWIELEIGLEDSQRLTRRHPITLAEAAARLATQTGRPVERCQAQLQAMLMTMSRPAAARGGAGDRAFLAFKLHRFLSGAGHLYSTLRDPGRRRVTLEGQLFDPDDPEARLYPTFFCRQCGQEHLPVTLASDETGRHALPRPIDETPLDDSDKGEQAGYLMPEPQGDADFTFEGRPEDYPEDWTESGPSGIRLRGERRKWAAERVIVDAGGRIGMAGRPAWFLPGKFRFCPTCGYQPAAQAREINKLAGLSAEGRSSATTLLVSSTLRWMNRQGDALREDKRKLLGFTDNRQDAALQAGHFNDFLFVTLLRAAILAAVTGAGPDGLSEDEFGRRVQAALGFTAANRDRRKEWMLDPEIRGAGQIEAERTLSRVLTYRVWADQRRGWRFTNPNLEELGLVHVDYLSVDELAADEEAFAEAPPELRTASADTRRRVIRELLEALRRGLAVTADALDAQTVEATASAARQSLREPWSISQQENPRIAAALIVAAPRRAETRIRDEAIILRGGPRSSLARQIGHPSHWGKRLDTKTYPGVLAALLAACESYQLVRRVATPFDLEGWRLAANAVRLVRGPHPDDERHRNPYFTALYETLSAALIDGGAGLFGQEGRAHTAQVDQLQREWREWRFRWNDEDRTRLAKAKEELRRAGEPESFLPVLFCSPTMELGVDISALNAVYLRNVPPTPANYAQRSGRAGRSGQAALVIAYCAAQSPHDQYYFADPKRMVSGQVRPPAIELANRDLIEAHLRAVWLAETGKELAADIPHVLDLEREALPVQAEIAESIAAADVTVRAAAGMLRILDGIGGELTPEAAPWAVDRAALAEATAAGAAGRFSQAFERWRQLYASARLQLVEANRRSEMHGLGAEERRDAKRQQAQANEQITLLERGTHGGSDFYTYRYLATEGFLPGYNFPRLPLYAYVPGVAGGGAAFLQRARFVAIAEFGPGSLIYHEGRAYRVNKAKLPPGIRSEDGGRLATSIIYVCGACGGAHEGNEPERCHVCGAPMAGTHPIRNVLRIDNVETAPAERITANDEDRQRRGFDIQTVFAWPRRDGVIDAESAVASDGTGPVLQIDYGSGTTISRINKGLRRRKEKSILGFGIDPATGRWMGGAVAEEGDDAPDEPGAQRVVPIVQDNKNAALLRLPDGALAEGAMATLQHALSRGLELVFQLEEGETLTEPVPSREERKAILAFEATEGGAGVLGRLASEPKALARVARAALELMHYRNVDAAIAAGDAGLLRNDAEAACVKGCYRCLLSYYNQPDQELIDRTDGAVLSLLLRLARAEVALTRPTAEDAAEEGWPAALRGWGLPVPRGAPLRIDGMSFPLVWPEHRVVAATAPVPERTAAAAEALGYAAVALPAAPGAAPPDELVALLGS
jgi:hypothetical protein